MGCLLCCFRAPEVDQDDEDFDDGQQSQQHNNATTDRTIDAGVSSSSIEQDLAIECDALLGSGPKDVNLSQFEPEPVLKSNKLIPENSEGCVVVQDDECLICFEEYTRDNPRIATKCSHHYHLGCILDWKERSEFCPLCSRVMFFEQMN